MKGKWILSILCIAIISTSGILFAQIHDEGVTLALATDQTGTDQEGTNEGNLDSLSGADIYTALKPYIMTERKDDPMIEVEENVWIKESNVKGVTVEGTTYYYNLFPHMSYDPVAREKVDADNIQIVYEKEDAEFPVLIYKLQ